MVCPLDKPSEETGLPWVMAWRRQGEYPERGEKGGKWLIFVPLSDLDGVWAKVRHATEEGRLGGSSKAATACNPSFADPAGRVICVYTYDQTDEADVMRVRAELREVGITRKIPYKADADTRAGRYRKLGHREISKYHS